MPYRFNILDIDNLDERYNDPSEDEDYEDYDEDEWKTQHEVTCGACSGTGEGNGSGYDCTWCGEKGYKIIKN